MTTRKMTSAIQARWQDLVRFQTNTHADDYPESTGYLVLVVNDRLTILESIAKAAREYCKATNALDKVAYNTNIPTRIWIDAEKAADAAYDVLALAALDEEEKDAQ